MVTAPPLIQTTSTNFSNAHRLSSATTKSSTGLPLATNPFVVDREILDRYQNNFIKLWNQVVTQWCVSNKSIETETNSPNFLRVAFNPPFLPQDIPTIKELAKSLIVILSTGIELDFTRFDSSLPSLRFVQMILPFFIASFHLKFPSCIRLSDSQITAVYSPHHSKINLGEDKFQSNQLEFNQLIDTLATYSTYLRVALNEQIRSLSNGVNQPLILNSLDKSTLNSSTRIPKDDPSFYPMIPDFFLIETQQGLSKTLLYCSERHMNSSYSHYIKDTDKLPISTDQYHSDSLTKSNNILHLINDDKNDVSLPHIQLTTSDSNTVPIHTDFQNLPNTNKCPTIDQVRHRYKTAKQFSKIPISRSDTGLSGLQLPSRSSSPSQFYALYSNKSDHTLHKVTAIQTALEDNKAPTYPEARDPLRRINTPKLKLSSGPPSPILKQQPSPQSLEKLGWTILFCTWVVVIGGIGSMFGVWKSLLGYDSSAVRYSLSYEKKTGYPISEYYACLFFMIFIVSWVWCVISWMGMKFYRHTKGGITTTKNE